MKMMSTAGEAMSGCEAICSSSSRITSSCASSISSSEPNTECAARGSAWLKESSALRSTPWAEAASRYADGVIARPPWWGGVRVVPEEYEFWQGRPNRLHDRIHYRRATNGAWLLERLSP